MAHSESSASNAVWVIRFLVMTESREAVDSVLIAPGAPGTAIDDGFARCAQGIERSASRSVERGPARAKRFGNRSGVEAIRHQRGKAASSINRGGRAREAVLGD